MNHDDLKTWARDRGAYTISGLERLLIEQHGRRYRREKLSLFVSGAVPLPRALQAIMRASEEVRTATVFADQSNAIISDMQAEIDALKADNKRLREHIKNNSLDSASFLPPHTPPSTS